MIRNLNIEFDTFIKTYIEEKYREGKQELKDKINIIHNVIKIEYNINNEQFFRSVLAILWYISNDKNSIKEYYEGLNESFTYFNNKFGKILDLIIIPEKYIENLFLKNESLDNITFEKALYLAKTLSFGLPLYNQNYSFYGDFRFADCGESIIRSFINIICYNKESDTFDSRILISYEANERVLEYYRIFDNFEKQTSDKKLQIFGIEMNSRDAWNQVVSNLPDVSYFIKGDIKYNICALNSSSKELNFLLVLMKLFNNIKSFDDFHLGHDAITIINESSKVFININYNGSYQIEIQFRPFEHYIIRSIKRQFRFDYTSLDPNERIIINILLKEYYLYLTEDNINEIFYLIPWKKEDLINVFNNSGDQINNEIYTKIFIYLYNKYKDAQDERQRIKLILFKIENLKNYELNNFGYNIIYNEFNNITQLTFSDNFNHYLGYSLNTLTNLKQLTFGYNFNRPVNDSLNSLTSLQQLTFGYNFNNGTDEDNLLLDDSLTTLTSLQQLTFGYNFNLPLNNSLKSLTGLQQLTFGYNFNNGIEGDPFLDDSLTTLTSLQQLTFGYNFNLPLYNSLKSLTGLQQLTFNSMFNNGGEPLHNSLNALTSLQQLTFSYNFNNGNEPLGTSLNALTSLKELTFDANFNNSNQSIKNILFYLINLEKLNFSKKDYERDKNDDRELSIEKQDQDFLFDNIDDSLQTLLSLSIPPSSQKFPKLYKSRRIKKFGSQQQQSSFSKSSSESSSESFMELSDKSFSKLLSELSGKSSSELSDKSFRKSFSESLIDEISSIKLPKLKELTLPLNFNKPLNKLLYNLPKLQQLTFGDNFNHHLDDSLNRLSNLKQLTFGYNFDNYLGDSLNRLNNLEQLTFGSQFDKPLYHSLNRLPKLKQLTFGNRSHGSNFNKPLNNSLDTLTGLEQLTFNGLFDQPLNNSLNALTNLQKLSFSLSDGPSSCFNNGNQPLDNSLDTLTSLKQLIFSSHFNQPLNNSLKALTSLQQLTFGFNFNNNNQPLDTSLKALTSLKELTFSSHFNNSNQPLGNSLDTLTSLEKLTFEFSDFNQHLGNSLDTLIGLKQLTFGYDFNQPLNNSLNALINLQELTFSEKFNNNNQPLGNSLDTLTSLQKLTIKRMFDQQLSDSLKRITIFK